MDEPLRPDEASRLIRSILAWGVTFFSRHAEAEMAADGLEPTDCLRVMRAGAVRSGELERGTWRYRVETRDVTVVVAFRSEREVVVVTAWRIERQR